MGQKDGEKWTAAVDSQPTLPKPDRLLGANSYIVKPVEFKKFMDVSESI